jgi:hypothetical protein
MVQNIPTTTESLMMYLADSIIDTRGNIARINNTLNRLQNDLHSAQSKEARMGWYELIDDNRLELENYEFRLDWLRSRLDELHNLV